MKTTKNTKSFLLFLLLFCSIVAVIGTVAIVVYNTVNYVDYEYCETAKAYLEKKYNKLVVIDEYTQNYCGTPAVYFHFEDDTVQYVSFIDNDRYLSSCLEMEAERIIEKKCYEFFSLKDVSCELRTNADKRLLSYYEQNGTPQTWDDDCQEKIGSIQIYYDSEKLFSTAQFLIIVEGIISCWENIETFEGCDITFINNLNRQTCDFYVDQGKINTGNNNNTGDGSMCYR